MTPESDGRVWGENADHFFADADAMIRWVDQPSQRNAIHGLGSSRVFLRQRSHITTGGSPGGLDCTKRSPEGRFLFGFCLGFLEGAADRGSIGRTHWKNEPSKG